MIKQETAQGVVYRRAPQGLEFLLVKRVPEDGGFWQAITGTIDEGERAIETLKRELVEEAGITNPLHISEKLEDYSWGGEEQGIIGNDQVFAVEVTPDTQIIIEPTEHSEFKWLPLQDAVTLLKYDGNKNSMRIVAEYAITHSQN
jgi:lipoyl(octanoyl) transferase